MQFISQKRLPILVANDNMTSTGATDPAQKAQHLLPQVKKGKRFSYSLPSAGPGADPSV